MREHERVGHSLVGQLEHLERLRFAQTNPALKHLTARDVDDVVDHVYTSNPGTETSTFARRGPREATPARASRAVEAFEATACDPTFIAGAGAESTVGWATMTPRTASESSAPARFTYGQFSEQAWQAVATAADVALSADARRVLPEHLAAAVSGAPRSDRPTTELGRIPFAEETMTVLHRVLYAAEDADETVELYHLRAALH